MEEENKTKIILIFISVSVIFVILAIFILIQIWMPKNTKKTFLSSSNGKLGTYQVIKYTNKQQITQYISLITNAIVSSDNEKLYSMLNEEYKKYFNIDINKSKEMFKIKGFLGKMLTSDTYTSALIDGKNIYIAPLKTSINGAIYDYVIITEHSPKNFSIAFDDFLYYEETPVDYYRDGLKLTIYNQVAFTTSYVTKMKITNISEDNIILNSEHKYENFYLKFNNESELLTNKSFLSGEQYEIVKNQELSSEISFEIPSLQHSSINSYLIKDIKFLKNGITKDLEFTRK